jgi:hypothetical protein
MRNLALILLLTTVTGCNNGDEHFSENTCPTAETLNYFPWVDKLIEMADSFCGSCEQRVVTGTYNEQTVVFLLMNDPVCNSIFIGPLHNCNGRIIKNFSSSSSDQEEFKTKVDIDSVLYRCQ